MSFAPLRRRSASHKKPMLPARPRKSGLRVSQLEDRTVPTGADMFSDAFPIDAGVNFFEDKTDSFDYTAEKGEFPLQKLFDGDLDAGTSMWWKFTLKEGGVVTLDTFGSNFEKSAKAQETGGPYGDTVLVVYIANDAGNIESLEPIAWNNDFEKSEIPGNSYLEFDAKPEVTYYVEVSGFNTGDKFFDRGTTLLHYQGPTTGEFPPQDPAVKFDGSVGVESDEQGQYFYWYAYSDSSGIVDNLALLFKDGEVIDKSGDIEGKVGFDQYGPGVYTLEVTPTNKYGESHTYRRSVTVYDDDPSGPSISTGGSSGSQADSAAQSFTWSISDPSGVSGASVTVTKNGSTIFSSSAASGSFTFDTFGVGTYLLSVSATDADSDWGNDQASSFASRSATVTDDDVIAPQITHGGSTGSETDAAVQNFTWSISDASGTTQSVTVTKNGSNVFTSSAASGSFNFDSLGLGTFVMTLSATDLDADWSGDALSTSNVTRTVIVADDDTTPPTVTLGGSTGTETDDLTQSFTWSVTDASGASAAGTITKDGVTISTISTASGSFNFDSFGVGVYVLSVTGTDGDSDWSGDALAATQTRSVTVVAAAKLLDWGDAPDTYGTTAKAKGANHVATGVLFLGVNRDAEADGLPGPDAVGDDKDGKSVDEDGVIEGLTGTIQGHGGSLVVVTAGSAKITGFVDAWIDFNGNGVFDDKDLITGKGLNVSGGGKFKIGFTVPVDATTKPTYARFRISTAGGLGPTGPAADGEVEDYLVVIAANNPPSLSSVGFPSVTVTGGVASNNGKFSDKDGDTVSFTATMGGKPVGKITSNGASSGNWNWSYNSATDGPISSGVVVVTASDGFGGVATTSFTVVADNAKPDFTLPATLGLATTDHGVLTFTTSFTDSDDTSWTGTVDYGDGVSGPLSISAAAKTFSLSHPYKLAGPYTVSVTVSDGKASTTKTMTVTVPTPSQLHVDDDWAKLAPGTAIADADPVAKGAQPATLGYDAFSSLAAAVAVAPAGGVVNVNAGAYPETVSVGKAITVNFQEAAISVSSLSDSVGTVAWNLNGITLSIGAGSISSPVAGAGGIAKTGPGTLTFAGSSPNSYSGATTVADGTLTLAKSASKTGSASIVGPVVIGDGDNNGSKANVKTAILKVDTVNQIADASSITFIGGDGRLFITASAVESIAPPTTAAGDIKVAGSLTILGAFTQSAGATTTLAGGTLKIGDTGILDYALGGTLQGSGTVFTNMLTSTGTIDPSSGVADADVGNASPGTITIRGNLQMTDTSVTNLDVGAVSDQLNVGINTALPLPAGSYTVKSNYDLDPYLRGDAPSVTEPTRRGINDTASVNGVVRFGGILNTKPIGTAPTTTAATMNFVWRSLNLPVGDLNPKGATLSSTPSDFAARNSYNSAGELMTPSTKGARFEARFMGSAGQANAIGQSVTSVALSGSGSVAVLSAPAYALGQAKSLAITPLTGTAGANANLKLTKQVWNAMRDSHTRVTLTVTNSATTALTGPFYFELTTLPAGATVFNANGKTQSGKPYLVVVPRDAAGNALSTLDIGGTATVELDLLTPMSLSKNATVAGNVLLGGLP